MNSLNIFIFLDADACGFFYSLAPEGTIGQKRSLGRMAFKNCITVLMCDNADGSEKSEVIFIGMPCKPRVYQKHRTSA